MADNKRMSKSPTMNDVAKEAGVSVATVSRVINGNYAVSKKLERKVNNAMKKLHYHPSALARSFKMQETRQIGLIVPLLDHPFFSRMAQVMEQELFRNNYRAIICNTEEDPQREIEYIDLLLRQRVDGIIINSATNTISYLDDLQAQNMPTVLIDRNIETQKASKVFSDNVMGGYLGMKYLIELGHRHIIVVAPFSTASPIQQRIRGIHQALEEFGIPEDPNTFITPDDHSFDFGVNIGNQLMQMNPRPTAVFALTDVTAIGIMRACWQLGLHIPDDISVMGYDDIPLASYASPALSTIAQSIAEMGQTAVQLLLNHIQNPDLPSDHAVLATQLVIRETTAPPNQ
jgi:LacI family transcriptional regulator